MPNFLEHFLMDPTNIAYIFSFVGLMVKDILFLRFLLLSSHMTWFILGFLTGNTTNIIWHGVFIGINSWRTGLILWERRKIDLPLELEGLYQEFFSDFTRKEVLTLWDLGQGQSPDAALIEAGDPQPSLSFIVEGQAEVLVAGQSVSLLRRGQFIGEMSFITGQPASAQVIPHGPLRVHSWDREVLGGLKKTKPAFWSKVQGLIGKDLVQKISEKNQGQEAAS